MKNVKRLISNVKVASSLSAMLDIEAIRYANTPGPETYFYIKDFPLDILHFNQTLHIFRS